MGIFDQIKKHCMI